MTRSNATWDDRSWPTGWTVRHVDETGSTNDDLISLVESGTAVDRSVLASGHQTAGRGRLDRRWDAPPGSNLLVSILFAEAPDRPAVLTQMVGVAAVRAIERLGEADSNSDEMRRVGLKWPNDVMLGDRKLAGVLAQRSLATGAVVVGIGLNVGWAPDGAASVAGDLELDVQPADILHGLLVELDGLGRPDTDVTSAYRARLSTLGRSVRAHLPGGRELVGEAVDVDDVGRLIVLDADGGRHVLDAGDVVHLRPA